MPEDDKAGESTLTVLVAGGANAAIGVLKLVAGLVPDPAEITNGTLAHQM